MARSAASPLALRFFGGLAYTVALLMVVSLVFVLISDPDAFTEQGVTAEMDAAMAFFGLLWGALLAAPMWVARWLGVRPRVGQLFGVFAVLSAVIQVALVVAAVVGPEVREVLDHGITGLTVAHLLAASGLGLALWRYRDGLQGLALELAIALVAYAALSALTIALPGVAMPLSGVALVVIYTAVGMILRRAAAQHG